jgi:hypothetical protein
MRDENRVKKCEKYLILLNKLAGVVQWQNGSFPSCELDPLIFAEPECRTGTGYWPAEGCTMASTVDRLLFLNGVGGIIRLYGVADLRG